MWHLSLEILMFRVVSLFAFACLTLTAVAFVNASKPAPALEPLENEPRDEPRNRCLALAGFASSKAGVEIAPMVGTIGARIAPVRGAAGGALLTESRRGTEKENGR